MTAEGTAGGEFFGPSVEAASLRIARGLPGGREWALHPVLGWANPDHAGRQDNRFLGLSMEYKERLTAEGDPGALAAWGGGGYLYSDFGQVLSAHAGVSAGWKLWPYMPFLPLMPFVGLDAFTSVPYNTRAIRGEEEGDDYVQVKHLTFTMGGRTNLGLMLQLPKGFTLTGSLGLGLMASQTDQFEVVQIAGSAEWGW